MNEPPEWEKPEDPYAAPNEFGSSANVSPTRGCLGIALFWGLPTVAVPVIILMFQDGWPIGVALALCLLVWLGKVHSETSSSTPGTQSAPKWARVLLYVVVQIIWIPLFWMGLVWGFCMVTGSGKF